MRTFCAAFLTEGNLVMKKREQYKGILRFWSAALLLVLQTAVFAYVWLVWYRKIGSGYFVRGNYVFIGLYALMNLFVLNLYGGLRIGQLRVQELLYSQILSIICVNAVYYLLMCLIGRWLFLSNLAPIAYMTGVNIVISIVWTLCTNKLYVKIYPPRQILVIYGKTVPELLIGKMKTRGDKYHIREVIPCQKDMEALKGKINNYDSILLSEIPADVRDRILKYCYQQNIRCYAVPSISDIMLINAEKIQITDEELLLFRNQGLTAGQRSAKRAFDIVAGLIAAVIASPFMIIIALAIKLYDGGPVFFTHDRLTRDGRVFKIYKFRSMRVQQEQQGYCLTRKNDDRITPVGKVIRKLHLDELPQIINIVKGDMSFVGPRPETPALAEEYTSHLPEFPFRLKVKAGLTGYAQVYGRYNTTPEDKLKMDLNYIEKYSFWLDLKLMLLTFKILFQKENTEGIESWQTSAEVQQNHTEV